MPQTYVSTTRKALLKNAKLTLSVTALTENVNLVTENVNSVTENDTCLLGSWHYPLGATHDYFRT